RDAIPEPDAEAAERLRRQRNLRNKDDRTAPARERRLAGADVHLRLAAAGRTGEQDVAARPVEQLLDARERVRLRVGQRLRRCFAARERAVDRAPLAAPL